MPYAVPLPQVLTKAGWRAKVFDAEGPETPHVTIRYKAQQAWRVSLRDGTFLVPGGSWNEIPSEIKTAVESHWTALRAYWDSRNPGNPVESRDV